MNSRQKEVIAASLDDEKAVLSALEKNYTTALADIKRNIRELQSNPLTQSKAYQLDFQKQLERQISGILDNLSGKNFASIADYLNTCYQTGFIGAMYDMQGQGVPLILPINQTQVLKAVQKTSDNIKLVNKVGISTNELKTQVLEELKRGFASDLTYTDIARNISNRGQANMGRSMTIARTEGHRVQSEAKMDSYHAAKAKGADIVKQWDATLDGATRDTHRLLDGQVRELDEDFTVLGASAPYPGGFGDPAEDCNCRCCMLQRARWAVEDETTYDKWNNETGGIIQCTGYDDFKEKYLKAAEALTENAESGIMSVKECKDFNSLSSYMMAQYGVSVDESVHHLDFPAVQQSIMGIERVMDEFPQAQSALKGISTSKSGVMSASFNGTINFNPNYYQNGDPRVAKTMVQGITTGFHPANTGVLETSSHEMGHLLERALIEMSHPGVGALDQLYRAQAWSKCTEATNIISEACKMAKKTAEGKGLVNSQLKAMVSGYATKNNSECLAECVADYVANGENASILSKEVWKILKGKLG